MLAPALSRRTLSLIRGAISLRFSSVAATTSEPRRRSELEVGKAVMKRIELVPRRLHEHLFGATTASRGGYPEDELPTEGDRSLERIQLPKLTVQGDLMGHFHNLAAEQFRGYGELLDMTLEIASPPTRPLKWAMQVGWTTYDSVMGEPMRVEFPDEDLLFFDIEMCVLDGQLPTLAIAMSPTRWYSWCSDRLVNLSDVPALPRVDHLIRLESPNSAERKKKIVIGHNVAFDRSRVMEQYYQEKTPARFWDTMSTAIAICGMADHQRIMYEQSDSSRIASPGRNDWITDWRMRVSKNSLGALHSKYCGETSGLELKKDLRDFFVREEIHAIRDRFQVLTDYCADDVQAAFEVNKALYPIFKSRFTSPVTYCGMLEMSSAYLPITSNWREFSARCDESAETKQYAARDIIKSAKQLKTDLLNDLQPAVGGEENPTKSYTRDPWMWCVDWTLNAKTKEPAWYVNLFKTRRDMLVEMEELTTENVKMQGRGIPRVFGLCYGPYPLFFKLNYGWGFLVPSDRASNSSNWPDVEMVGLKRGETVPFPNRAVYELIQQNRRDCVPEVILRSSKVSSIGIFDFYRLPHPDGKETNVGSPFIKDYRENYNEGVLWATRFWPVLANMLQSSGETRLWTNYRKRFNEQLAIWLDDEGKVGAIAPSIIPAGTVTRRAVHKLWLVSFNPKEGMIGSDLKSMVQCVDGWNLVGADVDSQEQWLAALFGDSITAEKRAGSTAFSNMLLAGSKSDQSDLHSVVAKAVGISRENAKVLNYARLYGAGEAHTFEFLKKSGTSEGVAKKQSEKLFSTTKGSLTTYRELHSGLVADFKEFLRTECPESYRDQHIYADNRYFIPVYRQVKGEQSALYEKHVAEKEESYLNRDSLCSRVYKDYPKEYHLYKGGFESYTFNFLELKAQEKEPKTPILGCRLSRALEPLPAHVADSVAFMKKYKRSVINWFVQSSAVDFLHLLLVSMNWLIKEYKIDARFVISIHDEVRYMVKSEDKYRCALALVLSNMYVRAAISHQLGIDELPKSIAFFSQVDIDTVLRKEVTHTCRTPTGQTVPPGEALDVHQIIEETGGSLFKRDADREEQRDTQDGPVALNSRCR